MNTALLKHILMRILSYRVLFLLLPAALDIQAQDDAALKQAAELGRKAQKLAQGGSLQFIHAETLFEEALVLAPEDGALNAAMGLCQLNGPHRQKALPYLMKAHEASPEEGRLMFLAAYALQLNAQWDEAIALYEQYRAKHGSNDPEPLYNSADKRTRECRYGKLAMASPTNAVVRNMGPSINSQFADYGPLITADGRSMFFTSRRPSEMNSKVNKATQEHFEDIYSASLLGADWSKADLMSEPVNTPENDASVGLFNDGRTMVIYRDVQGSGDMYESERRNGTWSEPRAFGPNVNTPGHESSAWYSFDRKWLFFVSDRVDDNLGGQDIFRSKWDEIAREWGPAENLGPNVNTAEDEDGVFVHPDGRTIYFSSKGHNSIGGFDIFRSTLENGQWSPAESLGWPINSPDDDLFFVLTADGRTGYFSSYRANGMGEDDIYSVSFAEEAPRDERLVSASGGAVAAEPGTVLLSGKVKSFRMLDGLEASIELMDLEDASLVATFDTDGASGDFLVAVPGGREYAMFVKASGYLVHSENISVPVGGTHLDRELDVTMEPMHTGHQVVMRNLFFNSSSATLAQTSLAELDQLEKLLRNNASLRLEISGHTDNTGSTALNQALSEERANAVRDHLLQRGIEAGRLQAIGMGESKPLAPNSNDANKALNRRTEIKVL